MSEQSISNEILNFCGLSNSSNNEIKGKITTIAHIKIYQIDCLDGEKKRAHIVLEYTQEGRIQRHHVCVDIISYCFNEYWFDSSQNLRDSQKRAKEKYSILVKAEKWSKTIFATKYIIWRKIINEEFREYLTQLGVDESDTLYKMKKEYNEEYSTIDIEL